VKRVALTLLAAAVLFGACSTKAKDHNAQDVSFAKEMTGHHQQAVEMATMALAQGSSPKVKDLATRIKAAQGPEIQKMNSWLSAWGEKAGSGAMDHGGSMGSMGSGMGMMTEAQMKDLRAATGAAFDRMFLTMMVEHHQGAVTMARSQLDKGQYAPAKQLAQQIVDAQQKEITEMQGLLDNGL